ncbi:MAG TPA: YihY/virulence factor BrkB family protein, partial [Clostridiales bacterium]|nr:YihY/virulence factor BrkB family protein [Clostridiales bacterium]
ALARGLNCVYGIKETRGYLKTRIASALYTLVFALILVITLVFLVFGNRLYVWLGSVFPVIKDTALIIISLRAIVGLAILIIFFIILFLAIPNRKSRLTDELPGAIVAAGGWMGFSYLYSFYIDNMANMSNTYGSLAAIIFLVLWLYFCMYILFIGGEINDVLASKSIQDLLKSPEKYEGR